MAKVTVLGDVMQIKSDLTGKEFDRIESFAPEMLKLTDEDGNEIFGISRGNAFYSKYGICFCSEDAEGKLFMSTNNPVTVHGGPEEEKDAIVKEIAPILHKLQAVETQIKKAEEVLTAIETEVRESVELA
jgi:hypothetical protein